MGTVRENGLIIKQNDYGEGHRRLSIFTESYGIIKAVSYGAKKQKRSSAASSQLLCFGEFELYLSGRDFANVNSIDVKESFAPVSEDILKLSLCAYLLDITYAMIGEGNPDPHILRTLLNILYAMAYRDEPLQKLKAVYELRLMTLGGYMPDLSACGCGRKSDIFDFDKGSMACAKCRSKNSVRLNESIYRAMKFITTAEDKRLLSFTASEELLETLGEIAEKYLMAHIERDFQSLGYYKLMCKINNP